MDHHELVIFCRDWFTAWMSDSPEQLREFYTDDAYYSDPARPQGLRGHVERGLFRPERAA